MPQSRLIATITLGLSLVLVAGAAWLPGAESAQAAPGSPALEVGGGASWDPGLRSDLVSTDLEASSAVGVYGPASGIIVANLTVRPGRYYIWYGFEANVRGSYQSAGVRCGIADANGRTGSFLVEDADLIELGHGWQRRSFGETFSLPDITLGLRCYPERSGLVLASFRNVTLFAAQID